MKAQIFIIFYLISLIALGAGCGPPSSTSSQLRSERDELRVKFNTEIEEIKAREKQTEQDQQVNLAEFERLTLEIRTQKDRIDKLYIIEEARKKTVEEAKKPIAEVEAIADPFTPKFSVISSDSPLPPKTVVCPVTEKVSTLIDILGDVATYENDSTTVVWIKYTEKGWKFFSSRRKDKK